MFLGNLIFIIYLVPVLGFITSAGVMMMINQLTKNESK